MSDHAMTKAKRILVIRHGQSEWNRLLSLHPSPEERYHPRMQSTIDCSLTPLGVEQARNAGLKLSQVVTSSSIDLMIISPLRRALRTAQHLLDTYPNASSLVGKVEISKLATEVMSDPCDIGSTPEQLKKEFPSWDFSSLKENNWWYGGKDPSNTLKSMIEQGEVEGDVHVQARVEALKKYLREKEEKGVILVVCHSDLIWWLTRRIHHSSGEYFGEKADNCEILDITNFVLEADDDANQKLD